MLIPVLNDFKEIISNTHPDKLFFDFELALISIIFLDSVFNQEIL